MRNFLLTTTTMIRLSNTESYLENAILLTLKIHSSLFLELPNQQTPLHIATDKCNIDIVKYLVEQGHADVNDKGKYGRTPLHIATEKCNIDIIKYLVEQCHADVNAKDRNEQTPLHIATEKGLIEVIKYFVEQCHANVEAKDKFGNTPL